MSGFSRGFGLAYSPYSIRTVMHYLLDFLILRLRARSLRLRMSSLSMFTTILSVVSQSKERGLEQKLESLSSRNGLI